VRRFSKLRKPRDSYDEKVYQSGHPPDPSEEQADVNFLRNIDIPNSGDLPTSETVTVPIYKAPSNPPSSFSLSPTHEIRLFHHYIHFSIDRPPFLLTHTHSLPSLIRKVPEPNPLFQHELYSPHELTAFEYAKQNPRIIPDGACWNRPCQNQRLERSFSFDDFEGVNV
jgi:hypothetical protein